MLVILPALSWQGLNPVDDRGDGIPATLASGGPIELARPLAHGLPPGFADEAGFLEYLDASHHAYQLTTDLGLVDRVGPRLSGHRTVVLAGSELWLPAKTATALRAYVAGGGHVLSFGIDSLRRGVTVRGGRAFEPTRPSTADALGADRGTPVDHNHAAFTVSTDELGLFAATPGTFPGYASYQPMPEVAAPARIGSAAGVHPGAPGIIGYEVGGGVVVQVAVGGFGSGLHADAGARALVAQILKVLGS
jgi:hypothetical protein